MAKILVDGEGAIFGRMATFVAKELLKGNSVEIVNSEKVVFSGNKENFVKKIFKKIRMGKGGSLKGPKYIRKADRLLKRMIRGMLPWDKPKGREAYKRLKCYIGVGRFKEIKNAKKFNHRIPLKSFKMEDIIRQLK